MERSYWKKTMIHRISRRRGLALAGGAAAATALLAACGGGSNSSGSGSQGASNSIANLPVDSTKDARRGGTNKFYINSDISTFDAFSANAPLNFVWRPTHNTLLTETPGVGGLKSPDLGNAAPDLAQSWEFSPDGLQVTLKLRPDVKWHNKPPVSGRAFGADDAVFSWQRFSDKNSNRTDVANSANPAAPIISMQATDANTVLVKLARPAVYLLGQLAWWGTGGVTMVPKETDSTFDPRKDVIGTGPFMLTEAKPSVGFTLKRNPAYFDAKLPYVDAIEMPIILEYAQGLSQLKAGNLYYYAVNGEDIIPTKRDVPQLQVVQNRLYSMNLAKTVFGVLPAGQSLFRDERVRQAYSMAIDRDLWLDTFNNVSKFQSQGLPVDTFWNTHIGAIQGWWLDPKGKDFGPNAKFYQHDIAEAKKLMAAAGFANGLDIQYTLLAGPELGVLTPKYIEAETGMAADAGFRTTKNLVDYASVYIPKYRNANGKFEGLSYVAGSPSAQDPVVITAWENYSKGGSLFFGFDVNGKGDSSGDPQIDSLVEKASAEFDTEKRRQLVYEMQRYLSQKMYCVHTPGTATGFAAAWPALQNFQVYHFDNTGGDHPYLWVDDTKAPLKSA